MAKRLKYLVGLSGHTLGISVPIAVVTVGAKIIEKHFIFDRKLGGPDAAFSLETKEFEQIVKSVREVEKSLGEVSYKLSEKVEKSREYSRSLFAVKNIKKGESFTEDNIKSIRLGYGLHPRYLGEVLGRKAKINIKRGTPLSFKLIK